MSCRLRLCAIDVRVGGSAVLRGIDLQVAAGDVVAIIGPNGAGKTSLLRVAARQLRPDRGDILLDEQPADSFTRRRWARRVALVPQHHRLPAGFTVDELVRLGRYPHRGLFGRGSAGDEEAVREAMAALQLGRLAARPVQRLSGGERQMVVLAMALAQQPRLLLLDEPTTHLDMAHELRMMDALEVARRRLGLSALVVLHDLRLAEARGDRIVLLRDGVVIADDVPARVRSSDLAACFGVDLRTARERRGHRRRREMVT